MTEIQGESSASPIVIDSNEDDPLSLSFPLGSHVCVNRVYYSHHGIISSIINGRMKVIHYSKKDNKPEIREEDFINDFLFDSKISSISVIKYEDSPYDINEIINRARSCIGLAEYNLFGNNCEHFASWCWTNNFESQQIQKHGNKLISFGKIASALSLGTAIVGAGVTLIGMALVNKSRRQS